jgi:hypothetical protein
VRERQLDIAADGRASFVVGGRQVQADVLTLAGLILDGALGTSFLMRGPVALDLRNPH